MLMSDKKTILLIDDDYDMHTICKKYVEINGYNFVSTLNGQQGLKRIQEGDIDLILLDYMMPEMNGYEFYKIFTEDEKFKKFKNIPVIMLTILSEDVINKKKLLSLGMNLFLQKPFGFKELMDIIKNIFIKNELNIKQGKQEKNKLLDAKVLTDENKRLKSQVRETYCFDNIIAITKPMRNVCGKLAQVVNTEANILVYGERGTGKELIARTIHANSKRKEGAFVAVDCAALPPTILESELFGYEKGAFTKASKPKVGLLESAHKGTIFLDEICELNFDLQAKLLKVLQERQFRRLGGQKLIDVNIRIISATNKNPEKAMLENRLREDLYYRLNVIPLYLPPLRERKEDIPLLTDYFLKKFCKDSKKKMMKISSEAISCLQSYHWPGNIQELQNFMERLVSVNNKVVITLKNLPLEFQENYELQTEILSYDLSLKDARKKWVGKFEKSYLLNLLTKCNGNISKVAKLAQVNRMTIYRMIHKYNIKFKKSIINQK